MIRKVVSVLSFKSESVGIAAIVIATASMASRLMGVLRDRLLSGAFGAGVELDAYYAAFRVPDFFFNLFVLGAVSAGLIPVLSSYLAKDQETTGGMAVVDMESWRFVRNLVAALATITAAASVLGLVFAGWIIPLITPGFGVEGQTLAIAMSRAMFSAGPLLAVSSVLGSVLQCHRRFLSFALAPIAYNIGIIFGIVVLGPRIGIMGAAWGVVIGVVAHFLIQYLTVHAIGFRFGWRIDWRHEGLSRMVRLALPRIMSLSLTQLNMMVVTGIASTVAVGAVAVINLANNLQYFPVSLIGISFAVASFPVVSDLAARGLHDEMVAEFSRTVRRVLFLAIPATVLFLLLRAQIVRVVLGTGRFDWGDTIATMDTMGFFVISLFAQALLPIVVRTFFALHDVKTTLLAALGAIVAERLIAWQLVAQGWGVEGLALAFSVGQMINLSVLWMVLRSRVGSLDERRLLKDILVMSLAAMALAFAVQSLKGIMAGLVDMETFFGVFTQAAVSGSVGFGVYLGLTKLMRLHEAEVVISAASRRLLRLRRQAPQSCTVAMEGLEGQARPDCADPDTRNE